MMSRPSLRLRHLLWSHGASTVVHVSMLAWLVGGVAPFQTASNSGQRVIRLTSTAHATPSPKLAQIDPANELPYELSQLPIGVAKQLRAFSPPVARQAVSHQVATVRKSLPASISSETNRLPLTKSMARPVSRLTDKMPLAAKARPTPRRHATPRLASVASTPAVLGLTRAQVIDNPSPIYPPQALAEEWEGDVILKVTIGLSGQVEQVSVLRSSGHRLIDASALEAVRQWRFSPARQQQRPIRWTAKLPIEFRLK